MQPLVPCPSCSRHVRVAEKSCPFCTSALALEAPTRPMPLVRLGRGATFAFGAAIATSAIGCGTSTTPPADDAVVYGSDGAIYGSPDVGPPRDAGTDGGLVAAYGGPPVDANFPDTGNQALYGAPPPPPDLP